MKYGFELVISSVAVICRIFVWFFYIDEISLLMSYILSYDDFWSIWKSKLKVLILCGMFLIFFKGLV